MLVLLFMLLLAGMVTGFGAAAWMMRSTGGRQAKSVARTGKAVRESR